MVENQTAVYREQRMTYLQSMDVAAYYAERRRRVDKPETKPCITPVHRNEGSRFDVRS